MSILTVTLDRHAAIPLGVQLADRIRGLITDATLGTGDRLPSTRALATELGVSRSVAEQAYDQLLAEGWVQARRGSGTFVAATAQRTGTSRRRTERTSHAPDLVRLDSGTPWIDPRHQTGWRRAWRQVSTLTPPAGYPDHRGVAELRRALADRLRRTRGLSCDPDHVVLTSGATDGLRHLLSVIVPGSVAVEDPGYRAAVRVAESMGRTVVDVPVSPNGLDVTAIPPGVAAVYVTPAHQHPTGIAMPAAARVTLLEHARHHDFFIVEDDYDSEFRYDVAPPPALTALDPDRGIYLGTASKSVSPGLRLGWLVAPQEIVERIDELRRRTHDLPSWPTQQAYLAMLRDGHVDRLIRSARKVYAARGATIQKAVPGLLTGPVAGMYVTIELSADQANAAVRATRAAGLELPRLSDYTRTQQRHGVVFGFGGISDEQFEQALGAIVSAVR
ncbi:PLP-dependent aminotransferase family protein [Rhodococcus sp. D2-41]|uniref:MocR-like pyridoxine biosynthesis transcription factor PdxR n=1 Tax=Speluncibacter jeojiensis TaxID=2710754 RepID=UPI00240FC429|nr:PLP-dependent aminotransferase family protein [Rhodococcus sp. D2-41]MDG3010687.1 PLP-dependent aminotransferase family protein [Rhodococcus sp. D2-41]